MIKIYIHIYLQISCIFIKWSHKSQLGKNICRILPYYVANNSFTQLIHLTKTFKKHLVLQHFFPTRIFYSNEKGLESSMGVKNISFHDKLRLVSVFVQDQYYYLRNALCRLYMPLCCSLHVWRRVYTKAFIRGTNAPCISPSMFQLFRLQESCQQFQSQDTHWFPEPEKFCPHHDHDISKSCCYETMHVFESKTASAESLSNLGIPSKSWRFGKILKTLQQEKNKDLVIHLTFFLWKQLC